MAEPGAIGLGLDQAGGGELAAFLQATQTAVAERRMKLVGHLTYRLRNNPPTDKSSSSKGQ